MTKFMNVSLTKTPELLNVGCIQLVRSAQGKTMVLIHKLTTEYMGDGGATKSDWLDFEMPINEFIRRMTTDLLEI